MKEESVSVKQGKKALFYLIVQYQTDKIEAERTIQMGNGNRGNTMIIKNGLVFTRYLHERKVVAILSSDRQLDLETGSATWIHGLVF